MNTTQVQNIANVLKKAEHKLTLVSIYYKYKTHSRFVWLRPGQKLTEKQLFSAVLITPPNGSTYTPGG